LKKIIILLGISVLFFLAYIIPASAKNEEAPKGLSDKGPLSKITFIHYKRGFAKPPGVGKDKTTRSSCWTPLAKGVVWKEEGKDIYVNSTYSGMNQSDVLAGVSTSANTWDSVVGYNLFGSVINDPSADWDDNSPDYNNEVSFGQYPQSGVIAVTNVWGYFGGPPQTRQIIEYDILFDTDYDWGDGAAVPTLMDFQNIAVHELGHGFGLGDIYDTSCSLVTMYGYSTEGETEKRSLDSADIEGINSLYK
jgi:hypothetical protein